jgi:hypothetical protein
VLETGKSLTLADILTSELETYDTLGGIHSLFTTLSGNSHLAEFAFLAELAEPQGRRETRQIRRVRLPRAELLPLAQRQTVLRASHQTLSRQQEGQDLHGRVPPRPRSSKLTSNPGPTPASTSSNASCWPSASKTKRRMPRGMSANLWEMIPPNPEAADRLFETALRGRAMEKGDPDGFDRAAYEAAAKSPPPPPMLPVPSPVPMSPADSFAAGGAFGAGRPMAANGLPAADSAVALRRSATVDELRKMPALKDAQDKDNDRKELESLGVERQRALAGRMMKEKLAEQERDGALEAKGTTLAYFGYAEVPAMRGAVRAFYRASVRRRNGRRTTTTSCASTSRTPNSSP